MPYASDNTLYADDRSALGTFSSHWAACAAMIRLSDPTFVSIMTSGEGLSALAGRGIAVRAPARSKALTA
jgi:hypothetical protein